MASLKERFQTHELPKSIKERMIDDKVLVLNMEDNCKRFKELRVKNKRKLAMNHLLQKVLKSDVESLKIDEVFLNEIDALYLNNIRMIDQLYPFIDTDNYMEIARLVDFLIVLYSDNYSVINAKRMGLKFNKRGIEFIDNRFSDTRSEVDEFFNEEFQKFNKEKNLEKIKKI